MIIIKLQPIFLNHEYFIYNQYINEWVWVVIATNLSHTSSFFLKWNLPLSNSVTLFASSL